MSTALHADQRPRYARTAVSPGPDQAWLTSVFVSVTLLVMVGFSLGLCAWELYAGDLLDGYVNSNAVTDVERLGPTAVAIPTSLLAAVAALVFLAWRRGIAVEVLGRLSRRVSPLLLVPLLPLLWRWQLWQGEREIVFLLLTGVLVFGGQRLMRVSLSTAPVPTFGTSSSRARGVARWLPFTLVTAAAGGYAIFFGIHTVVHHRNLLSASLDLGLEDNIVWNMLHGSPLFKASPFTGPTGGVAGWHAAYFGFLIAPLYAFRQNAETLLIIQAVLLGGAAIPLYLVARRTLPAWTACFVGILYVFYPPLHGSNLYDFHYPPLAPFFLWFTLYFVESRRNVLAAIFLLITCSVREDISAGLIIVGGYLILMNRRPRAGVVVALAGATYFVVMKGVIMPLQFSGQESFLYQYQGLVPPGEHTFGGVLKTVFGNPIFTLSTLLDREKYIYLLEIFLPLAFLPLRRPIGLLFCVPGFFFTLLSTGYRPLYQISFQYTAHWTAYLFIALIANLGWMERKSRDGDGDGDSDRNGVRAPGPFGVAWKRSWLIALGLAMLLTTHQLGAVLQPNTVRGGFGLYQLGTTADDLVRRRDLQVLLDKIPRMAKVASSENIVPHLSSRPDSYTLRVGVFDAEYMLFNVPPWEHAPVADALKSGTFGVMAEAGVYVLAKRGYPTTANAAVLARM